MTSYKWPRFDLEPSIEVAATIQDKGGGVVDAKQLAELLDYKSPASGTFANRLASAKLFGLVEGSSPRIRSSNLAGRILSPVYPQDEVEARLEAFLRVPLFQAFFDAFEGRPLPETKQGVENALKSQFGVEDNHAAIARVKLLNSAEQAGLFKVAGGRNKMIRPLADSPTPTTVPVDEPITPPDRVARLGQVPKVVEGLLENVPWQGDMSDQEIEEWAEFFKSSVLWHFRLRRSGKGGQI